MFEINLGKFKKETPPPVPEETKVSWQVEMKDAFRSTRDLSSFLGTRLPETQYPVFIPRTLAKKIRKAGKESALWKQFVPHAEENRNEGMEDPIGDHNYAKAGQLIHRYKNRALFLPTTVCPVNCRYCFRKNELANPDHIFAADFQKTLDYLESHPEVEEIIYSGGDPFILSNEKLKYTLMGLSKVPSIKYLRFHTRVPTVIPSRFEDEELIKLLHWASTKFKMVTIVVHLNHPSEIDGDTVAFFCKMKTLPIQLLTQTVLLKDVNDDAETLAHLFKNISELGARPYYLHHPDQVKGGMHFYLSLMEGRYLYQLLKQKLPGWALPHYVVDLPDGEGKVPAYNPESYEFGGTFINKDGDYTHLTQRNMLDS